MTERRALVLIDGESQELPIGDTLSGASSGALLPTFDNHATTETHFYFGWVAVNGGWLVRSQVRATGSYLTATITNNVGYADLDDAWVDRETLEYE